VDEAVTISGLSAGFTAGTTLATASTFGSFTNSVICTGCGNGGSRPIYTPLSFVVTAVDGTLTLNDFIANSKGYLFASDILGTNRKTGNVAALAPQPGTESLTRLAATPAPEPASIITALSGLAVACCLTLRRKQ